MQEAGRIRAPELRGETWLNTERPLALHELVSGGVALIDFWDYTCINCLRTLPYLIEWHERYGAMGLQIIGVHTPEFAFARETNRVQAAVDRLGIPYPVLLDNEQSNWSAYATRAWPTKHLIDQQRVIRYTTVGEGRYAETEAAIQSLLRDRHGDQLDLPPLLAPMRPTDAPGAVCYRTTPELHAGRDPAHPGDFQPEYQGDQVEEGALRFTGQWRAEQEFSEVASERATLGLRYHAAELNAVLGTVDGSPRRLFVTHDGQPLTMGEAGEDVVLDSEYGSYVMVSTPRLYNLVINPTFEAHDIVLESYAPGLRVYAFTFVSCTKPTREDGDIVMP